MLIITNGRVLVDPAMNEVNMTKLIKEWEKLVDDLYDLGIKFEKVEKPFLMYRIPEGLPWRNLIDAKPPETKIEFMAIGHDDEVQMPYSIRKTVRHNHSMDESKAIADDICEDIGKAASLEAEKKSITKKYNDEISDLQSEIAEKAQLHRQGYILKDKQVFTVMNFKDKVKYFNDVNTGELVATEEMNDRDQRTLFDIKGYDPKEFENDDITGFEIGMPEEFLEDELTSEQEVKTENEDSEDVVNLDENPDSI